MSNVTIYHNSKCSKCRQTMALLEENNVEPEVIEYLQSPPSKEELTHIIGLGIPARDLIRTNEDEWKTLGLDIESASDDDLINAVIIALENGWKLLKFYFMIGLPTERKEDIEAIADLMKRVVEVSKRYGRIRFNVSISPHSPKSHTPFQWEKQDTKEELEEKINLLKGIKRLIY